MGPDKIHKGFYSFDFGTPDGSIFVPNSYCYPEQNYLTKDIQVNGNILNLHFKVGL